MLRRCWRGERLCELKEHLYLPPGQVEHCLEAWPESDGNKRLVNLFPTSRRSTANANPHFGLWSESDLGQFISYVFGLCLPWRGSTPLVTLELDQRIHRHLDELQTLGGFSSPRLTRSKAGAVAGIMPRGTVKILRGLFCAQDHPNHVSGLLLRHWTITTTELYCTVL